MTAPQHIGKSVAAIMGRLAAARGAQFCRCRSGLFIQSDGTCADCKAWDAQVAAFEAQRIAAAERKRTQVARNYAAFQADIDARKARLAQNQAPGA